jgi:hypothetical protein
LVLSGIPFRTCWKYGERGWRYLWWDASTIVDNLLSVAAAHGLAARVQAASPDDAVARLVGIDGGEKLPLVVVQLGEADLVMPPADSLHPLVIASLPVAPRVLRFPLADEATPLVCSPRRPWPAGGQRPGRCPGRRPPRWTPRRVSKKLSGSRT